MSDRSARKLVALVGAGVVLLVCGWLDAVVIVGISRRANETFDPSGIAWALSFGYLVVAGAVLVVALLARWARSAVVGVVYVLVGVFFVFLPPINWLWAATINGASPILPDPLLTLVNTAYVDAEQGPLNAVAIIGAAMLLVGGLSVAGVLRTRPSTPPMAASGSLESEISPT